MKRIICDNVRLLILQKYQEKTPVLKISKMFNCSRNTVYSIIRGKQIKKCGRKSVIYDKKFIAQVKASVKKIKKYKKRVTSSKIYKNLPDPPSLSTVKKCLNVNKDFLLRSIKRKIKLSDQQKINRINIIKSWFKESLDFKTIVFTDEVRFSLDGPDNCLSWELNEDSDKENLDLRQQKGGSILLYMAISREGIIHFERVGGNMNSKKYIDILKDNVLPMLRAKKDLFILQQDNAKPHTSKMTTKFLAEESINILQWPSRSPDLSLIENIFKCLKDIVYGTADFENKEDLWNEIQLAINTLNQSKKELFSNLYDGMIERYLNVLLKDGDN